MHYSFATLQIELPYFGFRFTCHALERSFSNLQIEISYFWTSNRTLIFRGFNLNSHFSRFRFMCHALNRGFPSECAFPFPNRLGISPLFFCLFLIFLVESSHPLPPFHHPPRLSPPLQWGDLNFLKMMVVEEVSCIVRSKCDISTVACCILCLPFLCFISVLLSTFHTCVA